MVKIIFLNQCHCEGVKRPKQSSFPFPVIASEQSERGNPENMIPFLSGSLRLRLVMTDLCERLTGAKQSSIIKRS